MTILDPELRELLHRIDDLAPPAPPLPPRSSIETTHRSTVRVLSIAASVLLVAAAVTGLLLSRRSSTSSITPPTTAPSKAPSLTDLRTALGTQRWTLTSIDGTPSAAPFTMQVRAEGQVGGRFDCNDYSLDDSSPNDFGRWTMIETAGGCPGNEAVGLDPVTVTVVNTTSIEHHGNVLVLKDAKGHTVTMATPASTSVGQIHFQLPGRLAHDADGWTSTMESVSKFYANVPIGPSCSSAGCGWPLASLPADSIVLSWGTTNGTPPASGQPAGMAPNTMVGGRSATETTELTDGCRRLGADAAITVMIEGDIAMRACMHGPHLATLQSEVTAMLASVSIG
jgi:hypothetical protein